jgi:hypothetical protein
MTCREFRDHCDDASPLSVGSRDGETMFVRHLASCSDCSEFIRAREALTADLQVLRASAPGISSRMDAAVLVGYRGHLAGSSKVRNRAWLPRFGWALRFAVLLMLAAGLVLLHKKTIRTSDRPAKSAIRTVAAQPVATANELAAETQQLKHTKAGKGAKRTEPVAEPAAESAAANNPLPAGFSTLMYCDQLTCASGLEVIRVQMPPLVGLTLASAPAPVYADVLVGSDGIARGIRVVQ